MSSHFAVFVRITFIFLDMLFLNAIFLIMKWYLINTTGELNEGEYYNLLLGANSSWLICAGIQSLYNSNSTRKFESFLKRTVQSYIIFFVLTLTYLYFAKQQGISRVFVLTFLLAFAVSLLINRMIYLATWLHLRNNQHLVKRVMIIGYNDIGKKLATYFERDHTQMQVVGFCEEFHKIQELSNYPILNTPINAIRTSADLKITEIYSTILPEQDPVIYHLMHLADQACIRFKLVPDFTVFVNKPMHLQYFSGIPILSSRMEPLDDLVGRIKKRLIDVVLSLLMIVLVLSWLIPLISLAIWIESRGPVFFIQKRSGLNNNPFGCIKFRSMVINHEANLRQARRNDERFTRVGRFLRKTNLDEFPQFINVLKGDMSIVGPRPHMIKHTEVYSNIINRYMVRQFIKPGITGWAQINGHRGETRRIEEMEARVDHDIWYLENWSLILDMKIMMLTGYNLIRGDKNAF